MPEHKDDGGPSPEFYQGQRALRFPTTHIGEDLIYRGPDSIHITTFSTPTHFHTLLLASRRHPTTPSGASFYREGTGLAVTSQPNPEIEDVQWDVRVAALTAKALTIRKPEIFHETVSREFVHVSELYRGISLILMLLFLLSLVLNQATHRPLIDPYISFIGLLVTPFFYWIGKCLKQARNTYD
jgi:hypothetical protein